MTLRAGICPEAVALLEDKNVTSKGFREVKRAAPMRQIEIAELMVAVKRQGRDPADCSPLSRREYEPLGGEQRDVGLVRPEKHTFVPPVGGRLSVSEKTRSRYLVLWRVSQGHTQRPSGGRGLASE